MSRTVWRIVKSKYADMAFDGEGARLYGGRWNSVGTPMVYSAGAASLALVEILVHLGASSTLKSYSMIRATIDETRLESPAVADIPEDWTQPAPTRRTQEYGDTWARSLRSVGLRVPSVVVPVEYNYLINPSHPDFSTIIMDSPLTLPLDPRLVA